MTGFRSQGSGQIWINSAIMVMAALFYGATSITVKLMTGYLTVWQTAIGRFALGVILVPLVAGPMKFVLFGRNRRLLTLRGLCGTLSFLLIIAALRSIPLSIAMIIFYLWPVFCCLLSPWIAGEPITKKEWPFVGIALIGTAVIFWPEEAAPGMGTGHLFALGGAFIAGMAIILTRRLGRDNHPLVLYFYFCIVGGLVCIGPLIAQQAPVLPSSGVAWFGFLGIAVFALSGQVFMNQGMKVLNASRTGVIMMIEPLSASTFGALFLDEAVSLRLVIGACLILGSGLALTFMPAGKEQAGMGAGSKAPAPSFD